MGMDQTDSQRHGTSLRFLREENKTHTGPLTLSASHVQCSCGQRHPFSQQAILALRLLDNAAHLMAWKLESAVGIAQQISQNSRDEWKQFMPNSL